MSWQSWVSRIAGYGLAPFTAGASIPIGEGIAQGIDSRGAITDANQAQQAGTAAAMNAQQGANGISADVYNQSRADLAPYRDVGGQAEGALGTLMGFSASPMTNGSSSSEGGTLRTLAPGSLNNTFTGQPIDVPVTMAPVGRGQTLRDIQQGAQLQTQSSYGRRQGVSVRAPNGQTYMVPQDKVQDAIDHGGTVVS